MKNSRIITLPHFYIYYINIYFNFNLLKWIFFGYFFIFLWAFFCSLDFTLSLNWIFNFISGKYYVLPTTTTKIDLNGIIFCVWLIFVLFYLLRFFFWLNFFVNYNQLSVIFVIVIFIYDIKIIESYWQQLAKVNFFINVLLLMLFNIE